MVRSTAKDAIELLECLKDFDFRDKLHRIDIPTLVLHGSRDVISALENARILASTLPQAELVIAEGAGHVPTVTRPSWVADQIQRKFG